MNRLLFTLILLVSFNAQAGLFSGFKDFTHIGWLPDIKDTTHFWGGGNNNSRYNDLPIFNAWNIPPDATIGLPGDQVFLPGDDMAPVPIPPAIWLFMSGAAGIIAIGRRRHETKPDPRTD